MYSNTVALFFLSSMTVLAAAMPGGYYPPSPPPPPPTKTVTVTATPTATSISQCNTGAASCCNTVGAANSLPGYSTIAGLLGIVLQDLSVVVGLGCTPISIIGVGQGANCAQQPVCCTNNNFNGLINIGCTPISL